MSVKQEAQEQAKTFFDKNADADSKISATQLSDLVNRDAKTVRARLRKIAARDQNEYKNATWRITQTRAASELNHYMKRDATSSEQKAS